MPELNNENELLDYLKSGKTLPESFKYDGVIVELNYTALNQAGYLSEEGISINVITLPNNEFSVKIYEEL